MIKWFYISILCVVISLPLQGGNPDRQGQSGAPELLLNPWAKSAGFHSMNTAMIEGVEAMRINVAGLGRIARTEVKISHAIYLQGTEVFLNSLGVAQKMGDHSVFGLSIMSVDLGDIEITTNDQPDGVGASVSPNFYQIGLSYAHVFDNKISVGATLRVVSESTTNLTALGVAMDAGVQYVSGERDNFKFGVSLRNIGTPMKYGGDGLSQKRENPGGNYSYQLTYDQRSARFELPTLLNIGASYDFYLAEDHRFTVLGNFTSNAFALDEVGGGVEYAWDDFLAFRFGYKTYVGNTSKESTTFNVYTGLSAGFSVGIPFRIGENIQTIKIDYGYRHTNPWNGTHNLSLSLSF